MGAGQIPLQFRCSAVYFRCVAAKIPLFGSVAEFRIGPQLNQSLARLILARRGA
jgi:hypothetical protein